MNWFNSYWYELTIFGIYCQYKFEHKSIANVKYKCIGLTWILCLSPWPMSVSQSKAPSHCSWKALIDWPWEREGDRRAGGRRKERGEESSNIFSYFKNFSSLSHFSLFLSLLPLSLWCNSMCFTGPFWAVDFDGKHLNFFDVLNNWDQSSISFELIFVLSLDTLWC